MNVFIVCSKDSFGTLSAPMAIFSTRLLAENFINSMALRIVNLYILECPVDHPEDVHV